MIYLATPYSDPDEQVMETRFDHACKIAGFLMNKGHVVYSPIVHCHPIAIRVGLPRDWQFWSRFDHEMLRNARKMLVVKMAGWEQSKGIAAEIQIANELGIEIEYMEAL